MVTGAEERTTAGGVGFWREVSENLAWLRLSATVPS
jgi:hypothetical protein